MKNILRLSQIILLGFLLTAPTILFASNSVKQANINFVSQLQTKNLTGDTSEMAFKIDSYKDSSAVDTPKIQFSNPFPNPASSYVRINYKFPSVSDNGELRIMDLTGKTVMTYPLEGANNTLRFNVSDLNQGLYFCTIYYKGQLIKSNKLIVSNQQ